MSNFYIGLTAGSMVDVISLGAEPTAPIGDFRRWIEVADLGNGLARGMGRPLATWMWCWISAAQRQALMAYCPGKSARVFIRTEDDPNLHTSAVYEAAMIWPDTDNLWNEPEFRLTFRDLIEQTST